MIKSMTAFARAQDRTQGAGFCWEIRSVNHRYLDLSFRLPEAFRHLETALRTATRALLFRGKIECQLKPIGQASMAQSLGFDENLLDGLIDLTAKLAKNKNLQNDLTLSSLLAWPGVVQIVPCEGENLDDSIVALFNEALASLQSARSNEGQALKLCLEKRLALLQKEIEKAKAITAAKSFAELRSQWMARLKALSLEVQESRVEQELALMLVKMDVNEELDRLETHVQEIQKIMNVDNCSGRRLDFLVQELHREANTLSAKSSDLALTAAALEMKVLIDQMREQIQNIE